MLVKINHDNISITNKNLVVGYPLRHIILISLNYLNLTFFILELPVPEPLTLDLNPIISTLCEKNGFAVVEFRIIPKGNLKILEITIMKTDGYVSFNDCVLISKELSIILDTDEYSHLFKSKYVLEVISPGINRILKNEQEYILFTNQLVKVKTKVKYNNCGSEFIGKLNGVKDNLLALTNIRLLPNKKVKETITTNDSLNIELNNLIEVKLFDEGYLAKR